MVTTQAVLPAKILKFWFQNEAKWFDSDAAFDDQIRKKFAATFNDGVAGELEHWEHTPEGLLALVILYDQFARNMFRDAPQMYQTDRAALELTKKSLTKHWDQQLADNYQRLFLYMPLMHSEEVEDQNLSVKLIEKLDMPDALKYAKHHRDVVKRFGRFPHRNEILQRKPTKTEEYFLVEENIVW